MNLYIIGASLVIAAVFAVFYARKQSNKKAETMISLVNAPSVQYVDPHDLNDIAPSKMKLPAAQRKRRSAGLAAYVGFNGSAKTATMILDTLPDLAAGKHVLSNVALLSDKKAASVEEADKVWEGLGVGELRPSNLLALPHPLWIPLLNYDQILEFRNGVLLLDEAQGVADARDALGLPAPVRNVIFQFRRNDVVVRWTTIDWSSADKRIRRATQIVSLCRGFLPKANEGKIWTTKRLFWVRTYEARGFDDFTTATHRTSKDKKLRPAVRQWLRLWGGLKPAILSYDSGANVLTLGASSDSGTCMVCEGKKPVKRCHCSETEPSSPRKKAGRPRASASGTDGQPSDDAAGTGAELGTRPALSPLPTRRSLRQASAS